MQRAMCPTNVYLGPLISQWLKYAELVKFGVDIEGKGHSDSGWGIAGGPMNFGI